MTHLDKIKKQLTPALPMGARDVYRKITVPGPEKSVTREKGRYSNESREERIDRILNSPI